MQQHEARVRRREHPLAVVRDVDRRDGAAEPGERRLRLAEAPAGGVQADLAVVRADDDVAVARRRDAAERRSTSARVGQLKGNNAIK